MAANISKEFNNICWDAGVQCTVTMDPQDFRKQFQFKNLSSHPVELSAERQTYVLPAGGTMDMKTRGEEPKITKHFVFYRQVFHE